MAGSSSAPSPSGRAAAARRHRSTNSSAVRSPPRDQVSSARWSRTPSQSPLVGACAKLAKPGGVVVVSTINRNPKAYALAVVAAAQYVAKALREVER